MVIASKYWEIVKIDAAGKKRVQEIPTAKKFCTQIFGTLNISDAEVQSQLWKLYTTKSSADKHLLAECCLLCFISWIIEQSCLKLAEKFGEYHGFSYADLLPYVLDDDGRFPRNNSYESFSQRILKSFDQKRGSLASWTSVKVKQNPALSQFLLECGVYLVSDWAILNDTKPKQLERILREFHCLTVKEIEDYKKILHSYHGVYRSQRLQQRSVGIRGKCPAPTNEQLQQIANSLSVESVPLKTSDTIITRLQNLSTLLRQYRVHVRGGLLPADSLDAVVGSKGNGLIDKIPSTSTAIANPGDSEEEESEFLQFYRPQFQACLQHALATVIDLRVKQLEKKKGDKAKTYLQALQLLHCQNIKMTDIAYRLGLRGQDTVTRLLKLKEFRADIHQQMLVKLKETVKNKVYTSYSIEKIQSLEDRITIALNEQIHKVIEEATSPSRGDKSSPKSIFDDRLCKYLDSRNKFI
jgi:hypothetical protein